MYPSKIDMFWPEHCCRLLRNVVLAQERTSTRILRRKAPAIPIASKSMRSSWLFRQRAAGRLSRKEEQEHPITFLCTSLFCRRLAVLAPDAPPVLICDMLNTACAAFIATLTPLQSAFPSHFDASPWHIANLVCEWVFILSVLLRFRRGFNYDGVYVEDPTFIAMHYLRGNFASDVIASFPYAWLHGLRTSSVSTSIVARTVSERLLPLLRVLRVGVPILRSAGSGTTSTSSSTTFGLNPGVTRVLKLMLLLVYTCHWIGCIWWCVGELEQDGLINPGGNQSARYEDAEGSTWGPSPWLRQTQPAANQYAHALLWGASMMTGFVPFDVMPNTLLEVTVTVVALFFGLLVNTVIISSTTSALQSMSFKSARVVNKLETINAYMRHKHVPVLLARKITAFFEYQLSPHRAGTGGQHDLGELPPSLAVELIMHTHQDLFRECPIFQLISPSTALSLVERFEAVVYVPGEIVIHEGAANAALYVINRGLVTVWKHNAEASAPKGSAGSKKVLTTLTDNDFFGEQTLLKTITAHNKSQPGPVEIKTPIQASATCQCASYCDMFRLTSQHFMTVLEQARSRRGSLVGKDVAGVLANAANERNTRADRLRKRSLMWAAASQAKAKISEARDASGRASQSVGSKIRAVVAHARDKEAWEGQGATSEMRKMTLNSEEATTPSEGGESSSTNPRSSEDQTYLQPKKAEADEAFANGSDEAHSTSNSPPLRRRQGSESSPSIPNSTIGHDPSKRIHGVAQDPSDKHGDDWLKQDLKDDGSTLLKA